MGRKPRLVFGKPCVKCGTYDKVTRHHLKKGQNKTGEYIAICWDDHKELEEKIARAEPCSCGKLWKHHKKEELCVCLRNVYIENNWEVIQ